MSQTYRKKILVFMLICITLSSIPSIQEVGVALPTSPFSTNQSEFDTIESFDVHPANRWSAVVSGFTTSITDGMLNITDDGDGSVDFYTIDRYLRSLDGQIEILFKVNCKNDDSSGLTDAFYLVLEDATAKYVRLRIQPRNNDFAITLLEFRDVDSGLRTKALEADERIFDNIWYIYRLDYNTIQSTLRFRLFFANNNSKVFDYNYFDIGNYRPALFDKTAIRVKLESLCTTSGYNCEYLIDYIEAPFKERDWENTDVPSDPQWLQNNWNFHVLEDDINDDSDWYLTIPSLDSIAGELTTEISNFNNFGNDEFIHVFYYVYAVDADDGDLHAAVRLGLSQTQVVGVFSTQVSVQLDGVTIWDTTIVSDTDPKVIFSINLENDRSIISVGLDYYVNRDDNSDPEHYIFAGSELISNIATVPSQEFVLHTNIVATYEGDFDYTMMFSKHSIVERGEFSGKGSPIVPGDGTGSGGLFGWLIDIFITIIRALGNFLAPLFNILGEIISTLGALILFAIAALQDALETAIGFVVSAIEDIQGWLVTLGETIEDVVGLIQGWVEAIITDFIAGAQEFIEAILLGLLNLLATVWDVFTGIIFWIWDALTLPDLLAIAAVGLESIVEILLGAPGFILDLINNWILPFAVIIICIYWLWLLFLAFAEESFDPLAGFSNFFDRLTTIYMFEILGIGPLPIPIALFFIPMTYFLIVVPAGSIFAIW